MPSYENSNWQTQYHPPNMTAMLATPPAYTGAWLSLRGIRALGNGGNEWGGGCIGSGNSDICQQLSYPNPDLPIVQFVGDIDGTFGGTVTEWYLAGNSWENDTCTSFSSFFFAFLFFFPNFFLFSFLFTQMFGKFVKQQPNCCLFQTKQQRCSKQRGTR